MKKRSAFICVALLASAASATNWYASPDGTGGGTSPTDRGEVITTSQKMNTGDTMYLAPGTYNLDKTKSQVNSYGSGSYIRIPKTSTSTVVSNLTFIGESDNPEDVRLIGKPADGMRILYLQYGGHVIRNLLISGGYTSYQGSGICMGDDLRGAKHVQAYTASNCIVENCSVGYKGASRGGVWRNCVIRNNTVRNIGSGDGEGTGGGIYNATLYDCVITNNTAGLSGGGIAGGVDGGREAPTKAYNCLIGWNKAPYGGGAGVSTSFTARAYCQLFNCTVISNTASQMGGGAFRCTISNSVICTNYVSLAGNNALDGTFAAGGGVAYCDVLDSTLTGNTCVKNGAGAARSSLTGCRITSNTATGNGGGAYNCPLVKDCVLGNNRSEYGGAGCISYFENCVMTNNTANVEGGATYNSTSRTCIVSWNLAQRYAHARGAHYGDIVCGNRNKDGSQASGIGANDTYDGEPLPVVNCTVWNNTYGNSNVSRATLTNSVVWSVTEMGTHSAVNSFWRNGTVANQTGCISGTDKDPMFTAVDGTQSGVEGASAPWTAYMLRAKSPCFNKGILLPGQASETDVLGNPRVKYGLVDMGALECIQSLGTYFLFR
ncbi:MAG: hypothetical protein IJL17_06400 [Kiritimatiellae bacterium]|nr:hypothetical protein [Kiritimatiellia bacterium]